MTAHAQHHMRQSSIDAFRDRVAEGKHQLDRDRVAEFVLRAPGRVTRRVIATALSMETSTVSSVVNSLIKAKVIHEFGENEKAPCPITGKTVHWLTHKSRLAPQGDLFGGVQ